LIIILLGLDLNRVLYLGILLGSNSFRPPPSTWTDPLYLTQIQLYLRVESILYKLDVPVHKKVSYPKQKSLLISHVSVLPSFHTRVFTRSGNSLPISYLDAYPDFDPRLCPIPYPSRYPEPFLSHHPSHTLACYPELYPSHTRTRTQSG
jgi:hypothetical protein